MRQVPPGKPILDQVYDFEKGETVCYEICGDDYHADDYYDADDDYQSDEPGLLDVETTGKGFEPGDVVTVTYQARVKHNSEGADFVAVEYPNDESTSFVRTEDATLVRKGNDPASDAPGTWRVYDSGLWKGVYVKIGPNKWHKVGSDQDYVNMLDDSCMGYTREVSYDEALTVIRGGND